MWTRHGNIVPMATAGMNSTRALAAMHTAAFVAKLARSGTETPTKSAAKGTNHIPATVEITVADIRYKTRDGPSANFTTRPRYRRLPSPIPARTTNNIAEKA